MDAKAIGLPQIFRKSSHWPAGEDPSEHLSSGGANGTGPRCSLWSTDPPGKARSLCLMLLLHGLKRQKTACYKGFVTKMLPLLIHMSIAKKKIYYTHSPPVHKPKEKLICKGILFPFSKHFDVSGHKKLFPVTSMFQSCQRAEHPGRSTSR